MAKRLEVQAGNRFPFMSSCYPAASTSRIQPPRDAHVAAPLPRRHGRGARDRGRARPGRAPNVFLLARVRRGLRSQAGSTPGERMARRVRPRIARFDATRASSSIHGAKLVSDALWRRDARARRRPTRPCAEIVASGRLRLGGGPAARAPRRDRSSTRCTSAASRGTRFRVATHARHVSPGLIEKIPYLQDLGVTAVELLPVLAVRPEDVPRPGARCNYWGYNTVVLLRPPPGYSSRQDPLGAVDEFRDMVKALHAPASR